MSDGSKRTIMRIGCCQMAMLRGSYRYQMIKFESEQGRQEKHGNIVKSENLEGLPDSTEHLSMSEQTLGIRDYHDNHTY